jgi:hypothetical protein
MINQQTETTYIHNPLERGVIPPKQRGACRHLLGQYDPLLHAWCNGVLLLVTGENLYPRV